MSIGLEPPPVTPATRPPSPTRWWIAGLAGAGLILAAIAAMAVLRPLPPPPSPVLGSVEPQSVDVQYWELRIGDCFRSDEYDEGWAVAVVPCSTAHRFEMYEVLFLDPAIEPTEEAIASSAVEGCEAATPAGFTGAIGTWNPTTEDLDNGYFDVGCYVILDADQVGSVRTPLPQGRLGEEVTEVMAAVEELRGLEFLSVPEIEVISSEELLDRWAGFVEEQRVDGDPLCDLFRPNDRCEADAAGAVAAQIAAYYDGETGRITLPLDGDRLTPDDRVSLAHELTHSLTDGHFRFTASGNVLWGDGSTDAWYALDALLEGDATYLQELYAYEYLDVGERAEYEQAYSDPLPSVPAFDEATSWFIYGDGAWYVSDLIDQDGFAAVDRAYEKGVPSTEWILAGPGGSNNQPLTVDAQLPFPPVSYYFTYGGEWGAMDWYKLLWDDPDRSDAIAGWGGGSYAVYEDERGLPLVHIHHVGDDPASVERLFDALAENLPGPMGVDVLSRNSREFTAVGSDYLWIGVDGTVLDLIVAEDPADGTRAMQKLAAHDEGITEGRIPNQDA